MTFALPIVSIPDTKADFEREGLELEPSVEEDGQRVGTEPGKFEWCLLRLFF